MFVFFFHAGLISVWQDAADLFKIQWEIEVLLPLVECTLLPKVFVPLPLHI